MFYGLSLHLNAEDFLALNGLVERVELRLCVVVTDNL